MTESDSNAHTTPTPPAGADPPAGTPAWVKLLALLGIAALALGIYFQFGHLLTLQNLADREADLRDLHQRNPLLIYGAAFTVYVLVTALNLPGATAMTLVVGWYFGLLRGVILVSFASTIGATLAFLLSRFIFRDAVQARFGDRLATFNDALRREGAFYLFTLRLIPAIPFFVINLVMGLTPLRVTTYYAVSQLGMFPATCVYVYAGSVVPDLQTLADEGVRAAFSGTQLIQFAVAFALLGLFPLVTKKVIGYFRARPAVADSE